MRSPFRKIQPLRRIRQIIRNDEDRDDYFQGLQTGREQSSAYGQVTREILRQDYADIQKDIEAGRLKSALGLVAAPMQMNETDLFGLLPAHTGAALFGYVTGVLQGHRGDGPLDDPDDEAAQEPKRRLYGRSR